MSAARGAVALLVAALGITLPTAAARAEGPDGAVGAGPLVHDGEIGGAGFVDLWKPVAGPLHIGGALGLAAFPADNADDSTVFMPAGLSIALSWTGGSTGMDLRLRGGGWAGATNDGLRAGGWLAVGAYVEYAFDPNVALAAGVDGWFVLGDPQAIYVLPTLGLTWTLDRP